MQRVPKYRAWDISDKCWININKMVFDEEGELWYLQGYDKNEEEIDPPYFENETNWILMQYAGIKDMYGIDVFEGDVISDNISMVGVVEFKNSAYRVNYKNNSYKWFIDYIESEVKTIEVIGNVYENPEFLVGKI